MFTYPDHVFPVIFVLPIFPVCGLQNSQTSFYRISSNTRVCIQNNTTELMLSYDYVDALANAVFSRHQFKWKHLLGKYTNWHHVRSSQVLTRRCTISNSIEYRSQSRDYRNMSIVLFFIIKPNRVLSCYA